MTDETETLDEAIEDHDITLALTPAKLLLLVNGSPTIDIKAPHDSVAVAGSLHRPSWACYRLPINIRVDVTLSVRLSFM